MLPVVESTCENAEEPATLTEPVEGVVARAVTVRVKAQVPVSPLESVMVPETAYVPTDRDPGTVTAPLELTTTLVELPDTVSPYVTAPPSLPDTAN